MSTYVVRYGETISDVCMNATGNIANWSAILDANGYDDWTPALTAGDVLTIPDGVVTDLNTLRQLAEYPANNASIPGVYDKIIVIFDILNNNWILSTGAWNDAAIWIDTSAWID